MPNMDGIEFLKAVKQQPAYKFTPVIMLTTESQPEKKALGQAAGAKAWIVKPFRPEALLGAVQKLVLA
jgi:two-component system chemotaxis response regulator CheY